MKTRYARRKIERTSRCDTMTKRQRTDETVQRAVQHGVLASQLSTQNILQISAQSALSIIGAIANFLTISVIQATFLVSLNLSRRPIRKPRSVHSSLTPALNRVGWHVRLVPITAGKGDACNSFGRF